MIASLASLAAALITSRFWIRGTPIAAALTPVIVTIVSELLNRPTEAIARRVTTDRTAILPEATGAGAPGDQRDEPARPARDLEGEPAPTRIYRQPQPRRGWGRVNAKVVLVTAVLAFVIAATALTVPELIAGQSLGKGDRKTSLFGGGRDRGAGDEREPAPAQTTPRPETEEEAPEAEPEEEAPDTEEPAPTTEPPVTVPTVPESPPVEP